MLTPALSVTYSAAAAAVAACTWCSVSVMPLPFTFYTIFTPFRNYGALQIFLQITDYRLRVQNAYKNTNCKQQ